ncbi:MAG: translation initiation factor IF-3 [Acidimicrobiia bacterium]
MATPPTTDHRINDRIRAREVLVIGPGNEKFGVKPLPEALSLARQADLDLVEVAPMANPPVCKIMDYGKYRYEESQRARESRRKSTNISIKEMKYRPKISSGDFDTKTRKIAEFLDEGHKVKVTIMFRGREVFHPELGMQILDRIATTVAASAKVEAAAKLDGRNMTMVLAPDKKAQAKKAPTPKAPSPKAEATKADAAPADAVANPPADAVESAPMPTEAVADQPTSSEAAG